MKKWFKQPYFNRRVWLIENFDKLNLSNDEFVVVLLIDYCKEFNKEISYDYLCTKLKINTKKLDIILASLVSKHYLVIKANKKISFDIENIFEFDEEQYDLTIHKDIYDIVSDLISRPLTPNEMIKVNDLIEKYGENDLIDAVRSAEAYRKYSLAYVEGILKNEKKK